MAPDGRTEGRTDGRTNLYPSTRGGGLAAEGRTDMDKPISLHLWRGIGSRGTDGRTNLYPSTCGGGLAPEGRMDRHGQTYIRHPLARDNKITVQLF